MKELTEEQDKRLQRGHCPFCSSTRFLHGPCGGCSENIRCKGCGKEFCLMTPFTSLLLDRDDPGIYGAEFSLPSEISDIQEGLDSMFGKPTPKGNFSFAQCAVLGIGLAVGIFLILTIVRHIYGH